MIQRQNNLEPAEGISPSWVAKAHGFKSLKELSTKIGVSTTTLQRWYDQSPIRFMSKLRAAK